MNRLTPNFSFTEMFLDRASSKRKSYEWLLEQLKHQECQIIPIWKGQFLFNNTTLFIFDRNRKSHILLEKPDGQDKESPFIFLGMDNTSPIFVIDISFMERDSVTEICNETIELIDLRSSLAIVSSKQASILGYANWLTYWHRSNQFCGCCGNFTKPQNAGHSLICINAECGKEVFPRTDPVVIMLVEYKPDNGPAQCLLAEHHRIPDKVVSTLAGFVDPAETIEQAVIREVKEEAGVNVSTVKYITSQPWPFPSSLMLGFYATTNDSFIQIDDEEIRDAQWFTADEIRTFDEWGDEGDNYKLPRKESISRFLINAWVENN
ncbi:NAD(+) diphosphatase [Colwellia sp. RE-S-Sl-9]